MKKIGIITFHNAHNYGAVLQAYALSKYLEKSGNIIEIINIQNPYITNSYLSRWNPLIGIKENIKKYIYRNILGRGKIRERKFSDFIAKLPLSKPIYPEYKLDTYYDMIICGSDQVWNRYITQDKSNIYFLATNNTKIKIAYAASTGRVRLSKEDLHFLSSFKKIGVREKSLEAQIRNDFHLNAQLVPDPTLLLDDAEWEIIEKPVMGIPKRYLLFYSALPATTKKYLPLVEQVSEYLNLPIAYINTDRGKQYKGYKGISFNLNEIGPEEFVWLFHHAEFIIPFSFHGNMFSIIFKKNFASIGGYSNEDDRVSSLYDIFGIPKNRQFTTIEDFKKLEQNLDYTSIKMNIEKFKEIGVKFLKESTL